MTAATVDGSPSAAPDGKPKLVAFFDRVDAYNNLLLPFLAIVSALVTGAVIIGITDIDRLKEGDIGGILGTIKDAYLALPAGALGSLSGISETIVSATPLILAGLCFAVAAKSGLFNIGATGQMFAGGMASVWVGFSMDGPGIIQVPLGLLAGIVAGGLWGGIVGLLKARTGAHEVITTIMTNYIAGLLTLWLLKTEAFQQPGKDNPISKTVSKEGRLPELFFWSDDPSLRAHWGFLVAIAGAMFMWWLFERSKIGFELRTYGSNADAARYAGMKPATLTTLAMFIAGGLAGLGGATQILGTQGYATESFAGSIGFDAIAVALLGRNKPLGIVFAAFLFGVLEAGGRRMQLETDIPLDVVLVLRALIVLFIAAPALTRMIWRLKSEGSTSALQFRGVGSVSTDLAPAGQALTFEEKRHARNLGIAYIVLAGITTIFLTRHSGTATFNLDGGRSFGLPAQPLAWFVAASLAVVAGIQLWRGFGKWTNVVLAMASLLIFMSFLAWAAAGREFSFIGMLASAVTFSTPLIFGACAGIMCERSGVVNIAIEGLLLNGAFTSAFVGSLASGWPGMGPKSGFWIGVLAAMITSALFAWLLAWLAIRFKVDQVIVGFFINFFVLGLTSFLSSRVLTENPDYNDTPTLGAWKIPLLERIPVIGQILFQQTVFVYGAYLLVGVFTWFLFRTKWGLRTRAVGEHPRAADTLGVNVLRLRYRNVILAGAIAGFGGSWWTATLGRFNENITNGRGFIALAVVIVGRWHPVGALSAALLFGLFDSVADKLSLLNTGLPSEFIKMTPYLMTIVVVAGFVGRSRGPKAAGQPYESQ